jgi:1-acyl-sn-glycerol-3-phosphate acyltransferase
VLGRRIFSIIRLAVGFLLVAVCSTVTLLLALLLLPWRPARVKLCNFYGKFVGRAILWLAGATPVVQDRQRINEFRPAIYVSNHCSTLDAFVAIWICPIGGCGVAKKEILRIPFFGWLYWLSGHLVIDRGDRSSAIAAMKDTADFVKQKRTEHLDLARGHPQSRRSAAAAEEGLCSPGAGDGTADCSGGRSPRARELGQASIYVPADAATDRHPACDSDGALAAEAIDEHIHEVHKAFADQLGDSQKPLPAPAS